MKFPSLTISILSWAGAGLIYKPKENVSVYGSYSQTFLPRTGEQFAGLRRSSPGSVQSDILSPDEFENLEAGLKWDFTPRF